MRALYLLLGGIALALGAIGALFPILPTVPFLLLASFCFARSSKRLHTWFLNTNLYQNNLKQFVQERGMTRGAKRRIFFTITVVMGIGFCFMRHTTTGQVILFFVWLIHTIAIFWGVRTLQSDQSTDTSVTK